MMRSRPACLGVALATALLLGACVAAPGAPTQGDSIAPPTSIPSSGGSSDCLILTTGGSEGGQDIKSLRRDATAVVVGTFGGYEAARWTTPDGGRPTREQFQSTSARLVRPLAIETNGAIRGPRSSVASAVQRGGTAGCDSITYAGDATLADGQKYVFFLVPLRNSEQAITSDWLLLAAFPIGRDDNVTTAQDGELSLATLTDDVVNGPKPATSPNPGEPEPTTPG